MPFLINSSPSNLLSEMLHVKKYEFKVESLLGCDVVCLADYTVSHPTRE